MGAQVKLRQCEACWGERKQWCSHAKVLSAWVDNTHMLIRGKNEESATKTLLNLLQKYHGRDANGKRPRAA